MKKFRFGMEEVLRLRQQAEQDALEQLARAMSAHQQALADQRQHEQLIVQLSAAPSPSTAQQMLMRQTQLEHLEGQRALKRAAVEEAEFAVAHARAAAADAQAQRKVIENLRERRLAEWQQELQRSEEQQLGEVAQAQAHRRRLQEALQ